MVGALVLDVTGSSFSFTVSAIVLTKLQSAEIVNESGRNFCLVTFFCCCFLFVSISVFVRKVTICIATVMSGI